MLHTKTGPGRTPRGAMELFHYTAALQWGSGRWNSYHTLRHSLGVVGIGTLATHCHTAWGNEQLNWYITPTHYLGAVGGGTCASHYHIVWGYRALELVQYTDTLPHTATLPHATGY